MTRTTLSHFCRRCPGVLYALVCVLTASLICPVNIFSVNLSQKPTVPTRRTGPSVAEWPDTLTIPMPEAGTQTVIEGEAVALQGDSLVAEGPILEAPVVKADEWDEEQVFTFNPNPTRAVWLSALFPGLGQLYNRRYWKLPIVVGGFMGLGYATQWNNSMLRDYSRAYADLMDKDPSTNSYMDFFPPTTTEADLNKTWLQNVLKSRKDFYRRNRDLCIISMVGVYLLAMIDAYVDASLAHFDISPDLSLDMAPAIIQEQRDKLPSVGLQWALNF